MAAFLKIYIEFLLLKRKVDWLETCLVIRWAIQGCLGPLVLSSNSQHALLEKQQNGKLLRWYVMNVRFESCSGRDNFQTIITPSSYSTCPGLSIKWTGRRLVTDSGTKCAWVVHESKAVQIHVHHSNRVPGSVKNPHNNNNFEDNESDLVKSTAGVRVNYTPMIFFFHIQSNHQKYTILLISTV